MRVRVNDICIINPMIMEDYMIIDKIQEHGKLYVVAGTCCTHIDVSNVQAYCTFN